MSSASSAAASNPASANMLELDAKRREERFLLFARVLIKYLERIDPAMHTRANAVIRDCQQRFRNQEAGYESVAASMQPRLKALVGDAYWTRTESLLNLFLQRRRERMVFLASRQYNYEPCNNSLSPGTVSKAMIVQKFDSLRTRVECANILYKERLVRLGCQPDSSSPLSCLPEDCIQQILDYTRPRGFVRDKAEALLRANVKKTCRKRKTPAASLSDIEGLYEAGRTHVLNLSNPNCHLTYSCWIDFSTHVRSFSGWNAKRVLATPKEKKKFRETRKHKVYFVKVLYTAPGVPPNKKKKAIVLPPVHVVPESDPEKIRIMEKARRAAGYVLPPGNVPPPANVPPELDPEKARITEMARRAAGYVLPPVNVSPARWDGRTSTELPARKKAKHA